MRHMSSEGGNQEMNASLSSVWSWMGLILSHAPQSQKMIPKPTKEGKENQRPSKITRSLG